jgi:DNA uptake protein ComE-like DNA-binding protein
MSKFSDSARPASTARSGGWASPTQGAGHAAIGPKAHLGASSKAASSAGQTARPNANDYSAKTLRGVDGSGKAKAFPYTGSSGNVKQAYAKPRGGK